MQFLVIEGNIGAGKTTLASKIAEEFNAKLAQLNITDALVITEGFDEYLYLSARNLYGADVCDVASIDPVSLIGFKNVVMTQGAVKQLEEQLA